MNIKQYIKDALTEDDGQAVCVAKVMAVFAFFSYIGYGSYGLATGHFDLELYSRGLMEVLIGSGSIIAGKQITQAK